MRTYAQAWEQRQQTTLAAAQGQTRLSVPILRWPRTATTWTKTGHWLNQCMAGYYGVQALAGEPASTTFKP